MNTKGKITVRTCEKRPNIWYRWLNSKKAEWMTDLTETIVALLFVFLTIGFVLFTVFSFIYTICKLLF